jgi:hypothetical protein
VRRLDGTVGYVVEGYSLYALIQWTSGEQEEFDQFDPRVEVVFRAAGGE